MSAYRASKASLGPAVTASCVRPLRAAGVRSPSPQRSRPATGSGEWPGREGRGGTWKPGCSVTGRAEEEGSARGLGLGGGAGPGLGRVGGGRSLGLGRVGGARGRPPGAGPVSGMGGRAGPTWGAGYSAGGGGLGHREATRKLGKAAIRWHRPPPSAAAAPCPSRCWRWSPWRRGRGPAPRRMARSMPTGFPRRGWRPSRSSGRPSAWTACPAG
jgi:hypothetical protein